MNVPPFILASGSVTRKKMLKNAGVHFEACPARIDEDSLKQSFISAQMSARDMADALADAKAHSVSILRPEALVCGADQILEHAGNILSKSSNKEEARSVLKHLSGSRHHLFSAAVIYQAGVPLWRGVDKATMHVRSLSDDFIDDYLSTLGDDAFWSVGGYQLEGLGAQLFDKIDGDYFTVLGLPLWGVLGFLRQRELLKK